MTNLLWGATGRDIYEAGVDRGVFYPAVGPGVAWEGLTSVEEHEDSSVSAIIYVDGQKRVQQVDLGSFSAKITAFTYPDEFEPYDGYAEQVFSGQKRDLFNFTYRSLVGVTNDIFSYKLHLIYNCLAQPTTRSNVTTDTNTDILDFTWELTTTPVALPFYRPTAHIIIDSDEVTVGSLAAIENLLYGSAGTDPRMPSIPEILAIFEANAVFIVTDHGDGTATISGPDDQVFPGTTPTELVADLDRIYMSVDGDTFTVTGPDGSVVMTDADHFEITSDDISVIDSDHYSITAPDSTVLVGSGTSGDNIVVVDNLNGTFNATGAGVEMTDATHFTMTSDSITVVDADHYTVPTSDDDGVWTVISPSVLTVNDTTVRVSSF